MIPNHWGSEDQWQDRRLLSEFIKDFLFGFFSSHRKDLYSTPVRQFLGTSFNLVHWSFGKVSFLGKQANHILLSCETVIPLYLVQDLHNQKEFGTHPNRIHHFISFWTVSWLSHRWFSALIWNLFDAPSTCANTFTYPTLTNQPWGSQSYHASVDRITVAQ